MNKKFMYVSLIVLLSTNSYSKVTSSKDGVLSFFETNYINSNSNDRNKNMLFNNFKPEPPKPEPPKPEPPKPEPPKPEPPKPEPPKPEEYVVIWRDGKEIKNTKYYNETQVIETSENSCGLYGKGEGTSIKNSGIINVSSGIGITTSEGAVMENGKDGEINLKSNNSVGILASKDTTKGVNNGTINLTNGSDFTQSGMWAKDGGSLENNGTINVNSNNSYAMFGESKENETSVINNGEIKILGKYAKGIETVGDLALGINKNKITLSNSEGGRGMVSHQGATSINLGDILVENSTNSSAMNIGDGDSKSNKETKIENRKNITINNSNNSMGIRVSKDVNEMDKGIGINSSEGVIIINGGKSNVGMFSQGKNTEAINNGEIKISGQNNIGMQSRSNGKVINKNSIVLLEENEGSFGMSTFNGEAINEGVININTVGNSFSVGMQGAEQNGIATNKGIINLNNKNQVGMSAASSGKVINEGDININNSELKYGSMLGINVTTNGSAENRKNIIVNGSGKGMSNKLLEDKNINIVNTSTGIISIKNGSNSIAMEVGKNSSIVNDGNINIEGTGNRGIKSEAGSTIKTDVNSQIVISGKNNIGIKGVSSNIENKGNINITGTGNYGIEIEGSTLTNDGNITINGDNNVGIRAIKNSTLTNNGNIDIASGTGNKGIFIEKGSSCVNNGQIFIKGENVTATPAKKRDDANIGIANFGTLTNNGKIVSKSEFNTEDLGSGSVVMEKNSSIESEKISGEIKISSNMTLNSLENKYVSNDMFKTDNLTAKLTSNSALFDVKTEKKDGSYDTSLVRKNFNEILRNTNQANYLENNYSKENEENKMELYNKLKLAKDSTEIEKISNDLFGEKVFSSIQKQTFEYLKLNNNILKRNIDSNMDEDFRYIVGGSYNRFDSDSSDSTEGYIASLKNGWLGFERKINKNLNLGAVIGFGEYHNNMTNNSHREDTFVQGTIFSKYLNKYFDFNTYFTYGKSSSKLNRESDSFNTTLRSKFKNDYLIFSNEILKKININETMYVTPKLQLNYYNISQENIDERDGKYSISLDKNKTSILESGIGIAIGKDFYAFNDYILNTELDLNYFYNSGDLTNRLSGKISNISEDKFNLLGYKFDKNTGDVGIKLGITKNDFNIYTKYQAIIGDKTNNILTLGINYEF